MDCRLHQRKLKAIITLGMVVVVGWLFLYPVLDIYYSKEVKGQRTFFDRFCKYVFTCVNIILGVHDFFSSG